MSLLEPDAIARLRDFGGDKLLRGMIDLFVANAPLKVAEARRAFDAGEAPAVRAALHGLKSSAGQLGCTSVHKACMAGEALAGEGDLAGCRPHLELIERDLPLACEELTSIRPSQP